MADTPKHIAFIMDGNRRGGGAFGHGKGYEALLKLLPRLLHYRIPCVSFYALSKRNLDERSAEEIAFLFNIFRRGIPELSVLPEMEKYDVKFRAIGEWKEHMPPDLWYIIDEWEWKTRNRKGPIFALGLIYDFWEEIRALSERVKIELPGLKPVTIGDLRRRSSSGDLPDIDIIIRTGVEESSLGWSHESGFLHCLSEDAWVKSTLVFWPDFTIEHFEKILSEYGEIQRRRGA